MYQSLEGKLQQILEKAKELKQLSDEYDDELERFKLDATPTQLAPIGEEVFDILDDVISGFLD